MSVNTPITPPTALATSVPDTVGAARSVSAAVATLEGLPNSSSPVVPALAGHIATAKQHGQQWQGQTLASVKGALSGLTGFGALFDEQYPGLVAAAKELGTDKADAVASFKTLLTKLQVASKQQATKVAAVQGAVNAFDGLVLGDVRNFTADASTASAARSTAQARAQSAESQLRKLESERAKKQAILDALGIFSPLAKAIEELIEALGGQIGVTQRTLNDARAQINQAVQAEQAAAQAVSATNAYQSTAGTIGSAVNAMMSGWETLDGNFNTLLQSENVTAYNVFTQDVLAAVKADWDNLASQAAGLG